MAAKTATRKPATDVYQVITDQMIALLEQGTVPWRKPWTAEGSGLHRSMSTKKPYRGINAMILPMVAMTNGYTSPWWGTYKQITERGGQVRKGEKGTMVTFWKMFKVEDKQAKNGEKLIPMLRYFTVFNADQADGDLGLPEVTPRTHNEVIDDAQAIVDGYFNTEAGPRLFHGGDAAFYLPGTDTVTIPERDAYHSPEEYYSTAFHEAGHSTGHSSRLNREGVASFDHFGSGRYAKEELVAEMTSAFLTAEVGISGATHDNSAAYLANWLTKLQNDKKLIIQAAAQAQKAVDVITGRTAKAEVATEEEIAA